MTAFDNLIAKINLSKNWPVFVLLLVFGLNLFFSSHQIEKFAAVDEPLWLFGRVESYWRGILNYDLEKTLVSDKPGITVSLLSGIGLLWEKPAEFDAVFWEGRLYRQRSDIETLYKALRLPIAIFGAFSLLLFYFLLQKLFNPRTAALAIIFLGTSPILIGISRIINPDSLLWIFSSLAILAHLVYFKNNQRLYLFSAGIFLGLALLTKYVANLLFVYFLVIIFLEYVFNQEKYSQVSPRSFLRKSFLNYLTLSLFALGTFFALCPAAWLDPKIILDATILSQAFRSTWPIFVAFLAILSIDTLLLKSFLFSSVSVFFQRKKNFVTGLILLLFLLPAIFALANSWLDMRIINFTEILSSPKSSHKIVSGLFTTYLSNFYPLVFGISPLALFALFFAIIHLIWKKTFSTDTSKIFAYFIFFIVLYYTGSAVTNVAAMVRYQIMIYPIALISAGLALEILWEKYSTTKKLMFWPVIAILLAATLIPLYFIQPFFSSYNSILLPQKYFIDLKEMGAGSYEAAQYLNSLPSPENIAIWTDKTGICYFFKGRCFSGFNRKELAGTEIQYIVISSGRKNRTDKMARGDKENPLYFPKYYEQTENVEFWLKIDGRPNQFVKIIKVNE